MISTDTRAVANRRFAEMGLTLSFGDHVEEADEFVSTTIEHRIEDLHAAFADPTVDAIDDPSEPLRVRVGADAELIFDTWKALSDSDFEAAMRSTLLLDW